MNEIDAIQWALHQLRSGELGAHAFSSQVRSHDTLLQILPRDYRQALFDILDRLESSALFSEEITAGQADRLTELQRWIDKARAQLAAIRPPD
jgi:hypothetical protein